jgi:hypothetical protein
MNILKKYCYRRENPPSHANEALSGRLDEARSAQRATYFLDGALTER